MYRIPTIAALCLTAALAFADTPPAQPPEGQRIERLALLLDLDAGQKVAVQKVLTEQRQEMKAERKKAREAGSARPSREEMKAHFEAQHAAVVEKLRPILSDVQLKKFEALTDRPMGPPPGPRGKRPTDDE